MSFRNRDSSDSGNPNKIELGEPRRFGGGGMDDKQLDDSDDRRFDSGRGRRPPFGRGRRPSPPGRARDFGYGRDDPPSMRDRSPPRSGDDRFSDRYKKDDGSFPKRDDGRKDMGRGFYGDRDRFMEGRSRMDGPGGYNSRFEGPGDNFKPRGMPYSNPAPVPASKSFPGEGFPKPNECEIIVVNKQQRLYAENVEARIKALNILVDVLFLKDEALLTQTIDDIARRGSLFAMVINPQNETHGSVTVNILHGTPQEHRNMPLEDALKLISRNFHDYIRTQRETMERERAERGQYDGGVSADKEMQFLLRMLADGRWISLTEINVVIRYLTERRDKMQAAAGDDRSDRRPPLAATDNKVDIPFKPKENIDAAQKEQDLQNRIINIMNQGAPQQSLGGSLNLPSSGLDIPLRSSQNNSLRSPSGGGTNIPGIKAAAPGLSGTEGTFPPQQGTAASSGRGEPANQPDFSSSGTKLGEDATAATPTFLNFNNPSVQKALDNLIQSGPSLLKNISANISAQAAQLGSNLAGKGDLAQRELPATGQGLGPSNEPVGMQRGMSDMPGGQGRGNRMELSPSREMGGMGPQRPGPNMMGGPQRGGYGRLPDMGGMNRGGGLGYGGGNGPEPMDQQQQPMKDMGRMGGPPQGMKPGGQFSSGMGNLGQFGRFPGSAGQQGNFGGSFNNSGMGNMPRQNFGGNQGMGGGPRRY